MVECDMLFKEPGEAAVFTSAINALNNFLIGSIEYAIDEDDVIFQTIIHLDKEQKPLMLFFKKYI